MTRTTCTTVGCKGTFIKKSKWHTRCSRCNNHPTKTIVTRVTRKVKLTKE